MLFIWLTCVWLASAAVLDAQDVQFKTRAREVVVPVSVLTKDGKPVENLSAKDFVVLSDGKPQVVKMILREAGPLPVYAVVVVQTNDGSGAALAKIKKAAALVNGYITNNMELDAPS